VAQLIREMDLDLVAVQEIAHVAAFEEMLSFLPGYAGLLSPHTYRSGEYQKTGFIFKEDHVVVDGMDSLFGANSYVFPRPPLAAQFDVLLPGGQSARFLLVDVHLKAGMDAEDARRRRLAIESLKRYIDDFVANHPEGKAVVAGDFNDEVTDPVSEDVFQPLQAQGSGFTVLTRALAEAGEYSFVSAQTFIDQIIVTDSLRPGYRGGRTVVVPLDELVTAYDYFDDISDHLPVVASFPFVE
jgi:endonuclease/exonuclease/phosphatase family metal-dependent hydrolase